MNLWIFFFLFLGLSARAQIEIPDTALDEEAPVIRKEVPLEDSPEVKALIEQMKGATTRSQRFEGEAPKMDDNQEKIKLQYLDRTSRFGLKVILLSGEQVWGDMENQSFKVINVVGEFPLVLQQIKVGKRMEGDEAVFMFDLKDGDKLWGIPSVSFIKLTLPSGGDREILLREMSSIEILSAE